MGFESMGMRAVMLLCYTPAIVLSKSVQPSPCVAQCDQSFGDSLMFFISFPLWPVSAHHWSPLNGISTTKTLVARVSLTKDFKVKRCYPALKNACYKSILP